MGADLCRAVPTLEARHLAGAGRSGQVRPWGVAGHWTRAAARRRDADDLRRGVTGLEYTRTVLYRVDNEVLIVHYLGERLAVVPLSGGCVEHRRGRSLGGEGRLLAKAYRRPLRRQTLGHERRLLSPDTDRKALKSLNQASTRLLSLLQPRHVPVNSKKHLINNL